MNEIAAFCVVYESALRNSNLAKYHKQELLVLHGRPWSEFRSWMERNIQDILLEDVTPCISTMTIYAAKDVETAWAKAKELAALDDCT